jgi:NAD(P)-dependent dehydrogenase (short-subunit alcohol dehydrogenase family)
VARSSGARNRKCPRHRPSHGAAPANRGAAVCVNYSAHAEAAEGLAAEIIATGGRAMVAMADVAEAAAVEAMVARAEKELGPVTILVNNAGMSWQAR